MANFSDNFSGNLTNWLQTSGSRLWYIDGGLLKVETSYPQLSGAILNNTVTSIDGTLTIEYVGLDKYNGDDNLILFRYQDSDSFYSIKIDPGTTDQRGVRFGKDQISQYGSNDVNVNLYNSAGILLSSELFPYITEIPVSGKIKIVMSSSNFDIFITTSANAFVASGSHVDSSYSSATNSKIGFAHTTKTNPNIIGWNSISWIDEVYNNTYYVNNSGTNTAPYDTVQKAATNFTNLKNNVTFENNDVVEFVSSGGVINDRSTSAFGAIDTKITFKSYDGNIVKPQWDIGGRVVLSGDACSGTSLYDIRINLSATNVFNFISDVRGLTISGCEFYNSKNRPVIDIDVDYFNLDGWTNCSNLIFNDNLVSGVGSILGFGGNVSNVEMMRTSAYDTASIVSQKFNQRVAPLSAYPLIFDSVYIGYNDFYINQGGFTYTVFDHNPVSPFNYINYNIEHNTISGSFSTGVWIPVSVNDGLDNFNFSNNDIHCTKNALVLNINNSGNKSYTNVSINDNTVVSGTFAVHLQEGIVSGVSISGNNMTDGNYACLFIRLGAENTNYDISNNTISNVENPGLYMWEGNGEFLKNVTIERNIFKNCNRGILTGDKMIITSSSDLSISYNNFDNSGSYDKVITVSFTSGNNLDLMMVNNIFSSPSATIVCSGVSATIDNNLYDTNLLKIRLDSGVSSGADNVFGDPLWVDSNDLDYRLTTLSPAISTGYYSSGDDIGAVQYVEAPAYVSLSAIGTPTCSGSNFSLAWETVGAVSACIDGAVGWISTSALSYGTRTTSASATTEYTISAYGELGDVTTDNVIATIYNQPPVAYAGADIYTTATNASGVNVTFNASGSYDPQGQSITYTWLSGTSILSTSQVYVCSFSAISDVHTITLKVLDGCGNSATDNVSAYITSLVPPVADAVAVPQYVSTPGNTILDGSGSRAYGSSISNYVWIYNGAVLSAGSVSAVAYLSEAKSHTYTLVVYNTSGLSAMDTVTVIGDSLYSPSANAGADQNLCVSGTTSADECIIRDAAFDPDVIRDSISGDDVLFDDPNPPCISAVGGDQELKSIFLNGSGSLPPLSGASSLVWFEWNLEQFGEANVSGLTSNPLEMSATVVAVEGSYSATLTVSASNGTISTDEVVINLNHKPTASASDQNVVVPCSGTVYADIVFSGTSDTTDPNLVYSWGIGRGIFFGNPLVKSLSIGTTPCSLTVTNSATGCVSNVDYFNVNVSAYPMTIDRFEFDPSFVQGSSAFAITTLYWETAGATSAFIDNGYGWVGAGDVSAGSVSVTATNNITYRISAYDAVGCVRTDVATAFINLGTISACRIKYSYVNLYGPESIRYGTSRNINLTNFLPEYIQASDTKEIVQIFEDYLNDMYEGERGYTLGTSALSVTACDTSSCSFSAIDNDYSFNAYTSAGVSATVYETHTTDVERLFIDNACDSVCSDLHNRVSILEKINRLTELFDPDLIPIELIQFYANNLGYNVGLNRENVGIDFKGSNEDINQKKYLRFMVSNLPTWYTVKTTRNSIRMMLYTFGLIGDFIYYYTSNYFNPNVSVADIDFNLSGMDIIDGMSFKKIQQIKCDLSLITDFKKNLKDYKDKLKQLQSGVNNNWLLTSFNPISTKEDISLIPDDFFSSPHFRLWFNIDESLGNFSTEIEKQQLIRNAIMAIKPINTVFEGVTGYISRRADLYVCPYVRLRGHIILNSDGYADSWTQ